MPLFASLHGALAQRGTVRPYYFLNTGYCLNITGQHNTLAQPVAYFWRQPVGGRPGPENPARPSVVRPW